MRWIISCGILALLCSAPREALQERQKANSPGEDVFYSNFLAFETSNGNIDGFVF